MEWEPSQGPLSIITLARGSAAIRLIWESRHLKTPWQLAEVSLSSRWRHPLENESGLNRKACSHVFRKLRVFAPRRETRPRTIIQGMERALSEVTGEHVIGTSSHCLHRPGICGSWYVRSVTENPRSSPSIPARVPVMDRGSVDMTDEKRV